MATTARDRTALLKLVEHAQLVYLLTRYPKKQVLDDAGDVERLEQGLTAMRAAAKDLSAAFRDGQGAVPWDELAKKPDTTDLVWRKAKRIAPTVLRELMPLVEGSPEAAFFLRPETPPKKARKAGAAKVRRGNR